MVFFVKKKNKEEKKNEINIKKKIPLFMIWSNNSRFLFLFWNIYIIDSYYNAEVVFGIGFY